MSGGPRWAPSAWASGSQAPCMIGRYRDLGIPDAVKMVGSVGIWDWNDVEKWAKDTGRLK